MRQCALKPVPVFFNERWGPVGGTGKPRKLSGTNPTSMRVLLGTPGFPVPKEFRRFFITSLMRAVLIDKHHAVKIGVLYG